MESVLDGYGIEKGSVNREFVAASAAVEKTLRAEELLRRSLATTDPIESCLSAVERMARNVKRWHGGDRPLRWTATRLL